MTSGWIILTKHIIQMFYFYSRTILTIKIMLSSPRWTMVLCFKVKSNLYNIYVILLLFMD